MLNLFLFFLISTPIYAAQNLLVFDKQLQMVVEIKNPQEEYLNFLTQVRANWTTKRKVAEEALAQAKTALDKRNISRPILIESENKMRDVFKRYIKDNVELESTITQFKDDSLILKSSIKKIQEEIKHLTWSIEFTREELKNKKILESVAHKQLADLQKDFDERSEKLKALVDFQIKKDEADKRKDALKAEVSNLRDIAEGLFVLVNSSANELSKLWNALGTEGKKTIEKGNTLEGALVVKQDMISFIETINVFFKKELLGKPIDTTPPSKEDEWDPSKETLEQWMKKKIQKNRPQEEEEEEEEPYEPL